MTDAEMETATKIVQQAANTLLQIAQLQNQSMFPASAGNRPPSAIQRLMPIPGVPPAAEIIVLVIGVIGGLGAWSAFLVALLAAWLHFVPHAAG